MKKILFSFVFMFFLNVSFAQLKFKNSSRQPVFVAYAMQSNEAGSEVWWSDGWFLCDPNETIVISSAVGLNPNVYYYAKSKDGKMVWDGYNRDYSVKFLVHNAKPFSIKNANMEYVAKENPAYEWLSFRHIRIPLHKIQYTIEVY